MELQTATSAQKWAREYELTYILRPTIDPDEADRLAARVSDVISRMNGKLTRVDNWGKRRLAYPIKKNTRGIFVYLRFIGFSTLVAELERNLRMSDDVVRFLTVRLRDTVNPEEVIVDPDEVKFERIEITEDEEEPGIEQRLGLLAPPFSGGGAEDEEDLGLDDDAVDEEVTEGAALLQSSKPIDSQEEESES